MKIYHIQKFINVLCLYQFIFNRLISFAQEILNESFTRGFFTMTLICNLNIDALMVPNGELGENGYKVINITSRRVDYIDTENITFRVDFENEIGLAKLMKIAMDQQLQREFQQIYVNCHKVVLKPDDKKEHEYDYDVIILNQFQIR